MESCWCRKDCSSVDITVLQELAEHEDIGSTQIYVHVCQEEVKKAMEKHPLG